MIEHGIPLFFKERLSILMEDVGSRWVEHSQDIESKLERDPLGFLLPNDFSRDCDLCTQHAWFLKQSLFKRAF